ncbi:hypothetical protein K2173_024571 [Erythroxylum novogranatense]|uniref:F-box domain-containing protein n=1 Tax=Erythroxylum novogranatense TaxID=1862640 RepID=A0AAV8SUR7_9ROSI|nr:hypothetical protein K2173_024571 [Erythroxylum novogranatense]
MWTSMPFDLLSNIFSFLSPDSLALAKSTCRHWRACANEYPLSKTPSSSLKHHLPWFVALPTRYPDLFCYVLNPTSFKWHILPLKFLPFHIRPIAPIDGLMLFRPTSPTVLQLGVCNPFTRQFRRLPMTNIARTSPAVGFVVLGSRQCTLREFRVYVAGGMSEAPSGGATYEPTLEMYDSSNGTWKIVESMPTEFAIRLTVWTTNESVYSNGVLYWITSARAYCIMALEIESNRWQELSVPMADRLEFATLVQRNGSLTLVGGTGLSGASVWELNEGNIWCLIEEVPVELGLKLTNWGCTKCVGGEGVICLYSNVGSGMVVWRENGDSGKWEWFWVEGACSVKGKQVQNLSVKGVLVHPSLALSYIDCFWQ